MAINNVQVNAVLNAAYDQLVGPDQPSTLATGSFVDGGETYANFTFTREQFTNALVNVLYKNWYSDSSYRSKIASPFFEDEAKYGAILQSIHAEMPEAQAAMNWQTFTSGVSTVGSYTVYIPTVYSKLYDQTASWQIPIYISGTQLDTAFRSETELNTYVNYLFMMLDNALVSHLEAMDWANRNNFIAEKINYAAGVSPVGIHVINLVEAYQTETGTTTAITVEEFLHDEDMLRFGWAKIEEIAGYMGHMNTAFNIEGYKRFTPDERMVCQILGKFETMYRAGAQAVTYHDELVKLPLYSKIPYWQALGDGSFDDISTVDVTLADGTTVTQTGVVGLLADKWAIMHTIKQHRVASKVFEPEDLVGYYYQFRDSYCNDLSQPAVVFTLEDVPAV